MANTKKLTNNLETLVDESLIGFATANPLTRKLKVAYANLFANHNFRTICVFRTRIIVHLFVAIWAIMANQEKSLWSVAVVLVTNQCSRVPYIKLQSYFLHVKFKLG